MSNFDLSLYQSEIAMLIGATICLLWGLSPSEAWRRAAALAAALTLIIAAWLAMPGDAGWHLANYVKVIVAGVGLLLLFNAMAVPDRLEVVHSVATGSSPWSPVSAEDSERGEFYAFFLLSLTGAMLCGGAGDLVWLFLALELTSLPTYVLVATSRHRSAAQESGVKYFFLGAMAAATFLYGFTLIYGATGYTNFADIAGYISARGEVPLLMTVGVALAVLGIAFKIAAVPMHFYAADVYQGATTPVTAFLAFVPKTAGFISLILVLRLIDWPLPMPIVYMIWIMAALTMTIGNVLGLLQDNVKRVLAYSSIAHSGYMLVALLGNHPTAQGGSALGSGAAAVLFYLPAYGLANLGAFAVLACLERRGEEAESYDDLRGLVKRSPALAAVLLISVLSLIGLPPMIGFVGKIYLFGSAIQHGFAGLVVVAVINSAISAVYYLRIVNVAFFGDMDEQTYLIDSPMRRFGAAVAAIGALVLGFTGGRLVEAAQRAGEPPVHMQVADTPANAASQLAQSQPDN